MHFFWFKIYMCMHVYMYIRRQVCMYMYACICMHTCMYIYVLKVCDDVMGCPKNVDGNEGKNCIFALFLVLYVCACVCTCMYAGMCSFMQVCMYMSICMHACMYIHACMHVCMHAYIHADDMGFSLTILSYQLCLLHGQ